MQKTGWSAGSHCVRQTSLRTGFAGWVLGALALLAMLPAPALAETRTVDLTGFDGVSASSGIHVFVDVGKDFSVVAESEDEEQLERLEIDVRRGTLRIRMDRGLLSQRQTQGWRITTRVALPELIHADASSGAWVEIDDMEGDVLELIASSGARIETDTLSGRKISANVSGGAHVTAGPGECYALEAVASDGSSLSLGDVACSNVDAAASSGASVSVHSDLRIDASASSGGTLTVYGAHQDMEISSSSGGNVIFP